MTDHLSQIPATVGQYSQIIEEVLIKAALLFLAIASLCRWVWYELWKK